MNAVRLLALTAWLILSILPAAVQAQKCNLHIHGQVRDSLHAEPMSFANVVIKETGIGVMADENGFFVLDGLCPGVYTLICSRVGCTDTEHRIQLSKDVDVVLDLHEVFVELESVEIREKSLAPATTQASQTLDGARLEAGRALGFGESLKRLPGVSTLNTGATISKPVIQGMHSNRVLMVNNGVRLESQQWGLEHAPEIDPFLAKEITVIKGAGSVRYGSDAMGGVILVQPPALPEQAGLGGTVNLQGLSNGRTGVASGILEGRLPGKKLPLAARLQGTVKKGGNLRTPDYFLRNTGVEEYNFSWATGLTKRNWNADVFYSRFDTRIGILRDAHIGNLTDLQNAIDRGRPLEDGSFSYDLGRPQQRAMHETVKASIAAQVSDNNEFSLTYSRQFNRRQEFDAHRRFGSLPEKADIPQIEFEITTHRLEADWEHRWLKNLHGNLGINAMQQVNTTDRGALLPGFHNQTIGAYWIERWKNYPKPLELEGAMRYDIQKLEVDQADAGASAFLRHFSSWSGSFGAIYTFSPALRLRLHTGVSWRAPHVSELLSAGVHHGSASYEEGNPDLGVERAWNNSLTLEWGQNKQWTGYATVFYNRIGNFIFLQPQAEPRLTIRGAFPAFRYEQADARLMGLEASIARNLTKSLVFEVQTSLLQGWNRELKDYLIFMPANQFRYTLRLDLGQAEPRHQPTFVEVSAIHVLRQRWAPDQLDYAPTPDAYFRLDLEATHTIFWGKQAFELGFSILNTLNTQYREYLNRLRYFAHEPGRNIIFRLKVPFGSSR